MREGLTVGDGFKFGCGFLLAGFIAWLAMAIIGGILMAIFGATLGALLDGLDPDMFSQIPMLLGVL
jgi:hypothetical protein